MYSSRRKFLKTGTVLATTLPGAVARASARPWWPSQTVLDSLQTDSMQAEADADLPAMLASAVDAAKSAGATYVDARSQLHMKERWTWNEPAINPPFSQTTLIVGVRALFNGYWGYAALHQSDCGIDQVAKLGTDAALQARAGARGRSRMVELAPAPIVDSGVWSTPVEIDPFSVSWAEKCDLGNSLMSFVAQQPFEASANVRFEFDRRTQHFVSSEGSRYAQTLTHTNFDVWIRAGERGGLRTSESIAGTASAGWEHVLKTPFYDKTRQMIEQASDSVRGAQVDVGRYDIVFDGAALAKLAGAQLGDATEIDRAMGYLADWEGTSYINNPLAMLGAFRVGPSLLNVTANRSMPMGLATVQWDDEGVVPEEVSLVTEGILTDLQTTRESASWLAPYYRRRGKAVRSHGGATLLNPQDVTQLGPSNLVIAPAKDDTSFDALCSGVKRGLAVIAGDTRTDHQRLNAESTGEVVYEIRNGKLGAPLSGATILTRAPQFWNGLVALGGSQTVTRAAVRTAREGINFGPVFTVSAPAGLFKDVPVAANPIRA